MSIAPPHISGLTCSHWDVAGRLQHVSGLADTLVATTAKLKADSDKASLLSKVPHAPLRAAQSGDTTASPLAGGEAVRGVSTRVSGPSKNEWLDPGANK